jgi:hypothetical protein
MGWICGAATALTACQKGSDLLGSGLLLANEKVEQLATYRLSTPPDGIVSLLQRVVLPATPSAEHAATRPHRLGVHHPR